VVEAPFVLSPGRVARLLFLVTALLVVAHLVFAINYNHIEFVFPGSTFLYVLFDVHGEVTIPTWYASLLLFLCALALAGITAVKLRLHDRYRYHWFGLALLFLAFSAEESADVHGAVSHKLQNSWQTDGIMTYPWVLPAAIFTLAVGLLYLPFLRHLDRRWQRLFLLAGGLFVGGALGLEAIEAVYDSAVGDDFLYLMMVTLEETLEMVGAIVFLTALLSYLGTITSVIRIDIAEG